MHWPVWGVAAHKFFMDNSIWLNPVLPLVMAASIGIGKVIGEPWFWRTINVIFDSFQRDVFDGFCGERTDDHRVTLYKWVRCCFWPGNRWHFWWPWGPHNGPWSGWLRPIVRSGVYKRGKTVFLANKRKPESAEGVVGNTYFIQSGVVKIDDLPDVHKYSLGDDSGDLSAYAKQTFVSQDWLQRRLEVGSPVARSFHAIRIEVSRARWGVVMIDSRAEKIPSVQKTIHKFQFMHKTLQALLERA